MFMDSFFSAKTFRPLTDKNRDRNPYSVIEANLGVTSPKYMYLALSNYMMKKSK